VIGFTGGAGMVPAGNEASGVPIAKWPGMGQNGGFSDGSN
jgi:hypothetical protein